MSTAGHRWAPVKTVAASLDISESTVRRHVRGWYCKSGRRVRLARWRSKRVGAQIRVQLGGDGWPLAGR